MERVFTKGELEVQNIKVGMTIYEYEWGYCIESEVLTEPKLDEDGNWIWDAKTKNGKIINYLVNPKYPHYAPNLYDYKAYQ